jgi:uncharacterized surface protein with fasciclin (FAS1) repeats
MKTAISLSVMLISALFLVGICIAADNAASSDMNIPEALEANENLTNLVGALEDAGLMGTLAGVGPFTVFAPDDEAFNNLAPEDLKALLENKPQLTSVLNFHVVKGKVMAQDLKDGESLPTLEGSDLAVKVNGTEIMLDNAKVVKADIETSNGVIHIIDAVLTPPA